MNPSVSENPLRESRLNSSLDFHSHWDVPSLNERITTLLASEIRRVKGNLEPDPGQLIPVLLAAPGYGKTHLFGRISHALGEEAFFVFVPAIEDPSRPLEHIRWHVVEALFRPRGGDGKPGRPTMLAEALAQLCRESFAAYVGAFPPSLAVRHVPLQLALEEGQQAVEQIAAAVTAPGPYRRLADSLSAAFPHLHAGVVRALVFGWSAEPHAARRWLRGEPLPEADLARLGLSTDVAPPLAVIQAICTLLRTTAPVVICCDQLESVLKHPDGPRQLGAALIEVLHTAPNQYLILSCMEAEWQTYLLRNNFPALTDRTRQPFLKLDFLREKQAVELVANRLRGWPGARPELGRVWPFDESAISGYAREKQPTPRALILRCARALDRWFEEGQAGTIDIYPEGAGPDLEAEFLQQWARELQEIEQDARRTPANTQEERLYRGVREALHLALEGGRPMAGAKVGAIAEGALGQRAREQRYGLRVVVSASDGERTLIVPVTKVDNAHAFRWYFGAVREASAPPAAGALFIHATADFAMGKVNREAFETAQREGWVRLFALDEHTLTFRRLECLLTFLDKAASHELIVGGRVMSVAECRALITSSGLLEELDLFKGLTDWPARHNASAGARVAGGPTGDEPSNGEASPLKVIVSQQGTMDVEVVDRPAPPILPGDGEPPSAVTVDPAEMWGQARLRDVVEKLGLWGQAVKPDGVQVGPTFVRLRVRPAGSRTSYRRICDRAEDLKIHLGLDVAPIIASQARFISIDVQRPERTPVPLAEVLAAPARAGLEGQPGFPLGLDVAGQAHWLNLGDPSDCHLLLAGTTGSGKSEFLRCIVASLAARLEPRDLRFVLIDPQRLTFNFAGRTSPYLAAPVAHDIKAALPLVKACVNTTKRRLEMLAERQVTDVSQLRGRSLIPRIVLVIDEFASLMEDGEIKKTLSELLRQIGSLSRAAGIHLVLSTQRPDKNVVTPLLRDNLPGRIAMRMSSRGGSELILGAGSAEALHLLGAGDLLWKHGGGLLRLQSPRVSTEEFERRLRVV